jgi:hypothetical protein
MSKKYLTHNVPLQSPVYATFTLCNQGNTVIKILVNAKIPKWL